MGRLGVGERTRRGVERSETLRYGLLDGIVRSDAPTPPIETNWRDPTLRELTTAAPLRELFERVLGGDVVTYDFKWLSVVGPGYHWDAIYWAGNNSRSSTRSRRFEAT